MEQLKHLVFGGIIVQSRPLIQPPVFSLLKARQIHHFFYQFFFVSLSFQVDYGFANFCWKMRTDADKWENGFFFDGSFQFGGEDVPEGDIFVVGVSVAAAEPYQNG